jgi:hypothetical protein
MQVNCLSLLHKAHLIKFLCSIAQNLLPLAILNIGPLPKSQLVVMAETS